MLTLYGTKGSGSAAIEAALARAGLAFTSVDAASWNPGPGHEALLQVNPLGQIPTLVLADGTVLTESAAILIHLGLTVAPGLLLPAEASERARAVRGLVYIAANCYAAISVIDYPERWCEPCDDDMKARIRAGTRARLHEHWRVFADQFSIGFEAAKPGALELLAAVVSKWSGTRPMLQAERPTFHAQLLRVEQHPEVAAVFQRHWP
ncbi:glutathione S-transferase [Roseateles puraquae]|uniref:Glutathione S-transferase n=1 Tax=Roseateles puraquae TaxID=431059 RepID=A0A254NA66_9BURK|nr:glutathione S-transferase [Roseateles puraquae]MDG0854872.1 glutathione S-transferase [Roseateles puraquae]OWR04896.1 glutathione S-transferase [Roseateles puraquae]